MAKASEVAQRIAAALDRIEKGLDALAAEGKAAGKDEKELARLRQLAGLVLEWAKAEEEAELARLRDSLDAEKMANAKLEEQVKALHGQLEEKGGSNEKQREAMTEELKSLRSLRDADRAELDDILGALEPLLQEGANA